MKRKLLLFVCVAELAAGAAEMESQRQILNIPTNTSAGRWWFVDVDGDGRADLLALDPARNKLWISRQSASGFAATPQQALDLPERTAWMAVTEVEPHAGRALLVSTASGLGYFRQKGGIIENQPNPLIKASQIFTNHAAAVLITLAAPTNGTSLALPVIYSDQAILYRQDAAWRWVPGETVPLELKHESLWAWQSGWATASQPARALEIWRSYRGAAAEDLTKDPANEIVKRIVHHLEEASGHWQNAERVNITGNTQADLVVWSCSGYLDTKTESFVYPRSSDNQLPEQPAQVLRCRGFPVQVGPGRSTSPLCDLDGDGRCELALVRLKTAVTTSSGLADVVMSGGMDWVLTVRAFKNGAFSSGPNATVSFTTMVPPESGPQNLIWLEGDFNGDGRRDLMVKRSPSQWQVFLSSTNGAWFEPKPGLTLDIPVEGDFVIRDLNGDGRSDLIVQPWNEPRLFIFLSQAPPQSH